MNKIAGIKDCVEALAMKRGIPKTEAQGIMNDVLEVIEDKCVEGGVSFKGKFTIKKKVRKGRSGCMNGIEWETEDKNILVITTGSELEERLNK